MQYLKRKFLNYRYGNTLELKDINKQKYSLNGKFITRLSGSNAGDHSFIDIIALVPILSTDNKIISRQVPALLCKKCHHFYIFETEIENLEQSGKILCKVVNEDYWASTNKTEAIFTLKSESILHQMGYNVNSQINLKDYERQKILRDAISNGILTRGEVLSHIDYLIRRSKEQISLRNAVEKWKRDRQFVANIDLNLEKFKANEIKIRRRHV